MPLSIASNNAAILYSPSNWDVTSVRALTINAGAYFSLFFSGTSCELTFDISNMGSPASEIYYRIDGYEAESPWTRAILTTATITCAMPSDTSAFPYHLVEVVVKSTSETLNRWNAPSNTAVCFTGFVLDTGASVLAPGAAPGGWIMLLGDSITEGVRTVNSTAANDTDRNDAMMGWAFAQRRLLGVEVCINGFGFTSLFHNGSGNVPPLLESYPFIMQGISRTVSVLPKLIVINQGTNDSAVDSSTYQAAYITLLNSLLANYPNVPIAALRPFGGYQATAIAAACAGCNLPVLATYVDTTGFLNNAYGVDSLNVHPSGPNDLAVIAPQVAAQLRPLLSPTTAPANKYIFS